MITPEAYLDKLKEIDYLKYVEREIDPENEPIFNVYLNTREIVVPTHFRDLAVEGDHNAETVWFALDRWFDGVDLTTKKFGVQYNNSLGEEGLIPITTYTTSGDSNETIMLGWTITYDVTKVAGQLSFSLRIFSLDEDDNSIAYNLGTEMATGNISRGLYVTAENENVNPPQDNLTTLVDRIEELYQNNSLTALSYNDINTKTLPTFNGAMWKGTMSTNEDTAREAGTDRVVIPYPELSMLPSINNVPLIGNVSGDDLNISIDVDADLSTSSTNPVENRVVASNINNLNAEINKLWEEMDGMTFIPLSISDFTNNINLAEKGSTVTEVTFDWTLGGTPVEVSIDDQKLEDVFATTATLTFDIKDDHTFTILAVDKKENIATDSTDIAFVYKVYYGVAEEPFEYTEDFVKGFYGQLQQTRATSIDVVAEGTQYIYYCVPSEYGDCVFTSGGFTGGFKKVATLSCTNAYNVSTNYDIWKSDYANLGATNIVIS